MILCMSGRLTSAEKLWRSWGWRIFGFRTYVAVFKWGLISLKYPIVCGLTGEL